MRRDKMADSFVWHPADGGRFGRVLAMLAVAVPCALSGFVAGRLLPTTSVALSTVDNLSKPSATTPSSIKSTQTNLSEAPPKKDELPANKGAADAPSFTLLNPGTVEGNQASSATDPSDIGIGPTPSPRQELRNSELSLQTKLLPGKGSDKRVSPAPRRDRTGGHLADYGALRDYMMRR